jgi:hypothetical protein
MRLDNLIEIASSNHALSLAEVEATALELHLSVSGVIDLFARTVAIRYLQGDYSYEFADMAMNQLFGFAYPDNDLGFSDFAWKCSTHLTKASTSMLIRLRHRVKH